MKRIFLRLKQPLRNERGEITFFACFFVVGIVMLISFLLLYASIRITCINIRNGATPLQKAVGYRNISRNLFFVNHIKPSLTDHTCRHSDFSFFRW